MIQNEALPVGTKKRDKYVCPIDGCNLIPEILSANSDIGKIVLKCEKHGLKEYDVEKYLDIIDKKQHMNPTISNIDAPEENDLDGSRNIMLKKSKDLSSIIKSHIKILDYQEKNPDNYFHNQNIINLGYFLENESNNYIDDKKKKIKTIDDVIKEEINGKNKEEKKALKDLKDKYYIDLEKYVKNEEELYLKLKGPGPEQQSEYIKYLEDGGFKLISQLRFKNLKEINLANNKITNLKPLNNMLLPHLEIINFSDNQIKDITPLANLLSEYLSEIYLQNNLIQDLKPFLKSHFPLLEIFRVDGDGNKNAFEKDSFNNVKKKYKNIIFYKAKSWEDFNKEYEYDGNDKKYQDILKLDLASRRKEKILIDLFPLIIFPNNIKSLILDDNKLQDVSLLNRMPLYNLEFLDLSLNFIVNIKFLKKMTKKWEKLKKLYLNDNKINDISPLVKYGENNGIELNLKLTALTLKNNNLDLKDKTTEDILRKLIGLSGLGEINLDYENKDFETIIPNNNNTNTNN